MSAEFSAWIHRNRSKLKSEYEAWIERNRSKLGSKYEALFVRNVLAHLPEIALDSISAQLPFVDTDGRQRYCDFALEEGSTLRIAIEIDGYDKRGTGTGMSPDDFVDWERRHASLVVQGWHVIRFANTDVRDVPDRCGDLLRLLLQRERSKLSHLQELNLQVQRLAYELKDTHKGAQDRVQVLEREIARLRSLAEQAKATPALTPEEDRRLSELEHAQSIITILKADSSTMKTTIWAFTALITVLLGFLFLGSQAAPPNTVLASLPSPQPQYSPTQFPPTTDRRPSSQPPLPSPNIPEPSVVLGADCKNPLDWSEAQRNIGQKRAYRGVVHRLITRSDVKGTPTWIDIGGSFPEQRLTAVIWGAGHQELSTLADSAAPGATICVQGYAKDYRGSPEITVKYLGQIRRL